MRRKQHLKNSCTGKAALFCCGYSAKLVLKLGHRLGSHLAHHAPTKWASSQSVPSPWSQKSTSSELEELYSNPQRLGLEGLNEAKQYLDVEDVGFTTVCRTQFARMVGPPQNNVLLAVLPHELMQTPVALLMDIQLKWIKQCLRLKIPYILCSTRQPSKGLLYWNGEVFISQSHTHTSIVWQVFWNKFFPDNQEFLGHRSIL